MSWFYKGAQNLSALNADYVSVSTLSVSGNFSLPALSQYTPLYVDSSTNVVATPLGTGGYLKATGGAPFFQLSVPNSDVSGGANNAIAVYTAAGVLSSSSGSGYPKLTAGVPAYSSTVPIADISGGSANRMAVFTAGGVLSSSAGSGYAKFTTGVPSYAASVPIADVSGGTNNAVAIYTAGGVLSSSAGTGYAKFSAGVPTYSAVVPIADVSGGANNAMAVYTAGGVLSSSAGTGYPKLTSGVPTYSALIPVADVSGGTNNAMAVYTAGGVLASSSGSGYAKFTAGVPSYSATIPAADVTGAFSPGAITGGTSNALAQYDGSGNLGSSSGSGYIRMTAGVPAYISSVPTSDVSGNFSNYRIAGGGANKLAVYDGSGILSSSASTDNGYIKMTAGVPAYGSIPATDLPSGSNFAAAVYSPTGVLSTTATPTNYPASGADITYGQILYAPNSTTVPDWSTWPVLNNLTLRSTLACNSIWVTRNSSQSAQTLVQINPQPVNVGTTTDLTQINCDTLWNVSAGSIANTQAVFGLKINSGTNFTGFATLQEHYGVYIGGPRTFAYQAATAASLRAIQPTDGVNAKAAAWVDSLNVGSSIGAGVATGEVRFNSHTSNGTLWVDTNKRMQSSNSATSYAVWTQAMASGLPQWNSDPWVNTIHATTEVSGIRIVSQSTTGGFYCGDFSLSTQFYQEYVYLNNTGIAGWAMVGGTSPSNIRYVRTGSMIICSIQYFNYISTTGQIPTCQLNVLGPVRNTWFTIVARHNNLFQSCLLLVNNNGTIYLQGPNSGNINTNNGASSFPGEICVCWSRI